MLKAQEFLQMKSLHDLETDHGVYARWSTKNPRKFTLNYDQLEARESDPLSQECRGLVLLCEPGMEGNQNIPLGNTTILAYPFKRFFNYGQGAAAAVNFDDHKIKFQNKLDGSLLIFYHDPILNSWCAATRSVPDADLPIDGFDKTFTELFWKACKETTREDKEEFCKRVHKDYVYIFELCTPENQVVVFYPKYEIHLLGVRSLQTLKECNPENYTEYLGVSCAETYKIETIEQMIDFVANLNPSQNEGLVVCDSNFNRIKVKNPGYLALNRLKDSVTKSPRSLVEVILLEKEDDVMSLVPEHIQQKLGEYKEKLRLYIHNLDANYVEWYDKDRKTFALKIQANNGNMAYCMSRWMGRCHGAHEWIKNSKQKDGSWTHGFLDNLLEVTAKQ